MEILGTILVFCLPQYHLHPLTKKARFRTFSNLLKVILTNKVRGLFRLSGFLFSSLYCLYWCHLRKEIYKHLFEMLYKIFSVITNFVNLTGQIYYFYLMCCLLFLSRSVFRLLISCMNSFS